MRLLSRIRGVDAPAPSQSLAGRLGQWIDWRHAVALSAALDARLVAPAGQDHAVAPGDDGECARVRAALVAAIEGDRAFTGGPPASSAADDKDAAASELVFYRQRYVTLQQVMEGEIGRLRGRLRNRLAKREGALGRLAGIDAVMERALGAHERALLAPLPDLLARHLETLHQAAQQDPHAAAQEPVASAAVTRFRNDMRRALLAELDIRLQPSLGLLAALCAPSSESHAS
ncbi:hypothetical protein GCM10007067_10550 [Lysobacter bugurensis]|uniref:DUF3348 domain-containing protein n=1 Tax=Cognatilysobacter bugurensis TaxID=543356 RepID=A0A918W6Z9_9GAMM|nr:DUF3348 family protein [Lysobacter bugurensis]GHA75321.1 hypothetical protein GCM10007067_10550 [Lysobacter bugurensis]